jgi:hypothetical protein
MLPKRMNELLHDLLPEHVWQSRRKEEAGLVFMEFTSQDVELFYRHHTSLGIGLSAYPNNS